MFSPSMEQHNTNELRHIGAQELMSIFRTSHGETVRLKVHRNPIQDILHTRQWHHFFLVVANNSVHIFDDEDSKDAKIVFHVKDIKSVEVYEEMEPRIVQVLFNDPNRESLMFKCVSIKSRQTWCSVIRKSMEDTKLRDSGCISRQYSSTASWLSTSEAGEEDGNIDFDPEWDGKPASTETEVSIGAYRTEVTVKKEIFPSRY
ncbi:hypothetical protein MAR_005462 [Mya arenaria]|uniref:PH domain-containing protein n=1 Tax=Mya arenaria TaxID=6604 RepID=A0ABY7F2Q6_MYAAR|nr:hypothetical protein MAR_005462 [Mya arenaria]